MIKYKELTKADIEQIQLYYNKYFGKELTKLSESEKEKFYEEEIHFFGENKANNIRDLNQCGYSEEFENICNKYQLPFAKIITFCDISSLLDTKTGINVENTIIEMIELYLFLLKCNGSKIKLSGQINNTDNLFHKGDYHSCVISDSEVTNYLEKAIYDKIGELDRLVAPIFLKAEGKENVYIPYHFTEDIRDISNKELNEIYNHLKRKHSKAKTKIQFYGGIAKDIKDTLNTWDIVDRKERGKTTNMYCFIYDTLSMAEYLPLNDERRYKYEYIRDAMNGYEKWSDDMSSNDVSW
jgi:hypothetical protein